MTNYNYKVGESVLRYLVNPSDEKFTYIRAEWIVYYKNKINNSKVFNIFLYILYYQISIIISYYYILIK